MDASKPPGVPWGDATVSTPTLDLQVWAGSHRVDVIDKLKRDKAGERRDKMYEVRLEKKIWTRDNCNSCRKVGIPTYRPQFARLLTSEGFSPNRQILRVPKKAKMFGSFLLWKLLCSGSCYALEAVILLSRECWY